jgi:hypothetical protein
VEALWRLGLSPPESPREERRGGRTRGPSLHTITIRTWSWPPENAKDAMVAGSAALWSEAMESRPQHFPILFEELRDLVCLVFDFIHGMKNNIVIFTIVLIDLNL